MALRARKILHPRYLLVYGLSALAFALSRPSAGELALGMPAIALGAALRVWAAGHLVKSKELAVSGPYAHLRHPLYAGTLLMASGFVGLAGGRLAVPALVALWLWFFGAYFPRKERAEAARLDGTFGEAYRRYREEVPALWPRWRAWRPGPETARSPASPPRWSAQRFLDNNEQGTLLGVALVVGLFWLRWLLAS